MIRPNCTTISILTACLVHMAPLTAAAESPVRDPSSWKITFPVASERGNALEVTNPDFSTYMLSEDGFPGELDDYCYRTDEGQVFLTEYTGITTSENTRYSRTELREMNGAEENNWTLDGYGQLHCKLKISDLQGGANKLFFMQIHGKAPESKPLLKCIWEKGKIRLLTKNGNNLNDFSRQQSYNLIPEDEWFTCTINVSRQALSIDINGETIETYTDEEVLNDWPDNNTYYFKAGNYLQHDDFGAAAAVTFESITVAHSDSGPITPPTASHRALTITASTGSGAFTTALSANQGGTQRYAGSANTHVIDGQTGGAQQDDGLSINADTTCSFQTISISQHSPTVKTFARLFSIPE